MEYTDYYIAKGSEEKVRAQLEGVVDKALLIEVGPFVAFVKKGDDKKLIEAFDWLMSVFDAEGGAWGFTLCVNGSEVGTATYGDNAEWGIDEADNGFEGDLGATAKSLGMSVKALEACFNAEGVESFCTGVGFEHQYLLYPHDEMFEHIE